MQKYLFGVNHEGAGVVSVPAMSVSEESLTGGLGSIYGFGCSSAMVAMTMWTISWILEGWLGIEVVIVVCFCIKQNAFENCFSYALVMVGLAVTGPNEIGFFVKDSPNKFLYESYWTFFI